MRVGIVHIYLTYGGAERVALELADGLRRRGHEVAFFVNKVDWTRRPAKIEGSEIYEGRSPDDVLGYFRLYSRLYGVWRGVARGVRGFKPDILIFNQAHVLSHFARKLTGKPTLFYIHFPESNIQPYRRYPPLLRALGSLIRRPFEYYERLSYQEADAIFCNSRFVSNLIERRYGVKPKVLYPAVDHVKFKPDWKDEGYLLSVNRFVPYKNLELLLETQKVLVGRGVRYPLILAGAASVPEYITHLKAQARKGGIEEWVRFEIDPAEEALAGLYRHCSLFLYPPLEEHFGLGPIEAMTSGKPVLTCDRGGPQETVSEGRTGFRLPPTPEIWADKVAVLMENRPLRERMGREAYEEASKFRWESFVDAIDKALQTHG